MNTASVAGLVAGPFMGPYNASKHAVVALSETLHHEMAMMAPQVKVSVLCPGWVQHADRRQRAQPARARRASDAGRRRGVRAGCCSRSSTTACRPRVAAKVLDAIRAEQFWILPHDDSRAVLGRLRQRAARSRSSIARTPRSARRSEPASPAAATPSRRRARDDRVARRVGAADRPARAARPGCGSSTAARSTSSSTRSSRSRCAARPRSAPPVRTASRSPRTRCAPDAQVRAAAARDRGARPDRGEPRDGRRRARWPRTRRRRRGAALAAAEAARARRRRRATARSARTVPRSFPIGARVLTHCNTGALACVGYGTALGVIRGRGRERARSARVGRRDAAAAPGRAAHDVRARAARHRRDPDRRQRGRRR